MTRHHFLTKDLIAIWLTADMAEMSPLDCPTPLCVCSVFEHAVCIQHLFPAHIPVILQRKLFTLYHTMSTFDTPEEIAF